MTSIVKQLIVNKNRLHCLSYFRCWNWTRGFCKATVSWLLLLSIDLGPPQDTDLSSALKKRPWTTPSRLHTLLEQQGVLTKACWDPSYGFFWPGLCSRSEKSSQGIGKIIVQWLQFTLRRVDDSGFMAVLLFLRGVLALWGISIIWVIAFIIGFPCRRMLTVCIVSSLIMLCLRARELFSRVFLSSTPLPRIWPRVVFTFICFSFPAQAFLPGGTNGLQITDLVRRSIYLHHSFLIQVVSGVLSPPIWNRMPFSSS